METQLEQIEVDEPDVIDTVTEEIFDSQRREVRIYRWLLIATSVLLVFSFAANTTLALRPVENRYVRIDKMGEAQPIRYNDLQYTPELAEAKSALDRWADFRYSRTRASILKTFPKNYLFVETGLAGRLQQSDLNEGVIAGIAAGRLPEQTIERHTVVTKIYKRGGLWGGEAIVSLSLTKQGSGTERWVVPVVFIINPEFASGQSEEYQALNPLGFAITQMNEQRVD